MDENTKLNPIIDKITANAIMVPAIVFRSGSCVESSERNNN